MINQKFTKADRLLKTRDYLFLSRFSTKYHSDCFIILVKDSTEIGCRLGVTVSKRVGNACIRNWIKRTIREYFRLNVKELLTFCDINVIAKKGLGNLEHFKVSCDLTRAFDRVIARNLLLQGKKK